MQKFYSKINVLNRKHASKNGETISNLKVWYYLGQSTLKTPKREEILCSLSLMSTLSKLAVLPFTLPLY